MCYTLIKAILGRYKRKITDDCSPEIEVNDNFPQLRATSYKKKLLKALKRNEKFASRVCLKKFLLICDTFSFTESSAVQFNTL